MINKDFKIHAGVRSIWMLFPVLLILSIWKWSKHYKPFSTGLKILRERSKILFFCFFLVPMGLCTIGTAQESKCATCLLTAEAHKFLRFGLQPLRNASHNMCLFIEVKVTSETLGFIALSANELKSSKRQIKEASHKRWWMVPALLDHLLILCSRKPGECLEHFSFDNISKL